MRVVGGYISEKCAECKGRCCINFPGSYYPTDFLGPQGKLDTHKIIAYLKAGYCQIDWWEGPPPGFEDTSITKGYFIRPNITNEHQHKWIHPSWGGQCAFLEPRSGCTLPYLERPFGCRDVNPQGDSCYGHHNQKFRNDKGAAASCWAAYQEEILEIIEVMEAE